VTGPLRHRATGLARLAARRLPPVRRLVEERNRLSGEVLGLRSELGEAHTHLAGARAELDRTRVRPDDPTLTLYPPGHFYSPLPDLDEVRAHDREIFDAPVTLPGIDLREQEQLALVEKLAPYAADVPFGGDPAPGLRYHFANDYFGWGDGLVLFCLLRQLRPQRLVEVGSGYSSALMLDTAERFLDGRPHCTFIEPYPDRLRALLRPGDADRATVIEARVQDVDREVFARLAPGDVLFIDSSHVSKVGSDVNLLLLDVLPALPAGVHVHVHDIVWPFEYSRAWVYEGRAWTEAYLLRALLVHNERLRITWWSSFLRARHADAVTARLPLWRIDSGTSLWLETA
jgi:hypothetical protein